MSYTIHIVRAKGKDMEYTQNYLDVMLVAGAVGIAISYLLITGEWRKF